MMCPKAARDRVSTRRACDRVEACGFYVTVAGRRGCRRGCVQVLRTYGDYSLACRVGPGEEVARGGNKRPPSAPKAPEEEDPFRMILVLQKA